MTDTIIEASRYEEENNTLLQVRQILGSIDHMLLFVIYPLTLNLSTPLPSGNMAANIDKTTGWCTSATALKD